MARVQPVASAAAGNSPGTLSEMFFFILLYSDINPYLTIIKGSKKFPNFLSDFRQA